MSIDSNFQRNNFVLTIFASSLTHSYHKNKVKFKCDTVLELNSSLAIRMGQTTNGNSIPYFKPK